MDFHLLTDQEKITGKGQKHTMTITSDSKTCITVLSCVNAAGYAIPPLVIYARVNLTKSLYQGEIPGTMYALLPSSGWMDGEIFHEWLSITFLSMLHLANLYYFY